MCNVLVAQEIKTLKEWKFSQEDPGAAFQSEFDDKDWKTVTVPHDWAVEGKFNFNNDLQLTRIVQNGDVKANFRAGRSGALPIAGVGWYRTHFNIDNLDKHYEIMFDGAMSNAKVYINGHYIGERPFGYISFYFDITQFLKKGNNVVAVRLENFNGQTRWYSGAGLYRKVTIKESNPSHINTWGTFVTTPKVTTAKATVNIKVNVTTAKAYKLTNEIIDAKGKVVATKTSKVDKGSIKHEDTFEVERPKLWDIENPYLYSVKTTLSKKGKLVDQYITPFGIREIRFELGGFYLNDKKVRFKGVNLHHDLGPSGAAFYPNLFERQLKKMKEMGVNAIRFSHNPPAPECLDLCDRYGILAIDEAFDEWQLPKVQNGYFKIFDKWAKKDLTDIILRDRNHPSVIMWSIGNEIMEQYRCDPNKITKYLHDIVKTVDTTRATTCGFNNAIKALTCGMAQIVDVAGFNYKPGSYHLFREKYPNLKFYGSETGGALSLRDTYKFPLKFEDRRRKNGLVLKSQLYDDARPGNYENTMVVWGYPASKEFASQDYNKDVVYGEFVWTGIDYLGEPAPYKHGTSRSAHFAPMDMVGLPKDKFYQYKERWNEKEKTLHFFPHWSWRDRDSLPSTFPVVCYTNYPKAELFVNGKSYGIKTKVPVATDEFLNKDFSQHGSGGGSLALMKGYSIIWENVTFERGEAKVVAYNEDGSVAETMTRTTVYEANKLKVEAEEATLKAGDVAVYVITAVDNNGNWYPHYEENLKISIEGAGEFLASGNGDPTNLQQLNLPKRKFYKGKAVVFVKSLSKGKINISVKTKDFTATDSSITIK